MDEELEALLKQYASLRLRFSETLARYARHKLEHGTFPEDMTEVFEAMAKEAQRLLGAVYLKRKQLEQENQQRKDPFANIEVPDEMPWKI